jgi:hypothetical protein
MWNGDATGEAYAVHLVAQHFDRSFFAAVDPPARIDPSAAIWNAFTHGRGELPRSSSAG